jgi:hypothetical protein
VLALHSPQLLLTRISSEGSQAWYGARYEVPVTLDLDTARTHQIPITLTNTGALTWDSTRQPHMWFPTTGCAPDRSRRAVSTDRRTPFAAPVPPGSNGNAAGFRDGAGQPGAYTLVWDIVLETRAWLSTRGCSAGTDVRPFVGEPSSAGTTTMKRLPQTIVRPGSLPCGRRRSASRARHPLLGIGPDNFRHVYGRYLGLDRFDDRVHANDMYHRDPVRRGSAWPRRARLVLRRVGPVAPAPLPKMPRARR